MIQRTQSRQSYSDVHQAYQSRLAIQDFKFYDYSNGGPFRFLDCKTVGPMAEMTKNQSRYS